MAQARPVPAPSQHDRRPSERRPIARSLASLCRTLTERILERAHTGTLRLVERGRVRSFGRGLPEATIVVHDPELFVDVVMRGSVGFGEAYVAGRWTSPDLVSALRWFVVNRELLARLESGVATVLRTRDALLNAIRRNTPARSRQSVRAHYDLGNDFFELVLDPTLSYSCALFEHADDSLERASRAKIRHTLDKLGVGPGTELLEIGTGWGELAMAAAERGARVTTTTISHAQYELAGRRIAERGLGGRVRLLERDWRELSGSFDQLVCIEMVEAVGYAYYAELFNKFQDLVRPGGRLLLQAIVIGDERFEWSKDRVDFVKKHVFPGTCLPSIAALSRAASSAGELELCETQDLSEHYPPTLRAWRDNLLKNQSAIRERGYGSELIATWDYYLAYCEAGFDEGHIRDVQLVWERAR